MFLIQAIEDYRAGTMGEISGKEARIRETESAVAKQNKSKK